MRLVSAFYYPWWGAPPFSPTYVHWNNGDPSRAWDDIGASYFPALNPYASADPAILGQHMSWLRTAGVDVLSVSWWGPGSFEDAKMPAILDATQALGLKVNFMVEPYWKTADELRAGLISLGRYRNHPALFTLVRKPSGYSRPVIMLFAPPVNPAPVFDGLRWTFDDAVFLIRGDDSRMLSDTRIREVLSWTHADGMFNYSDVAYPPNLPSSPDYLLAFNVRPGFDDSRKAGVTKPTVIDRRGTLTYDAMWQPLVDQGVEWVTINSFNEWHEGSQIEPAKPHRRGWWFWGLTYKNYGALGQSGYLDRTDYWAGLYKG